VLEYAVNLSRALRGTTRFVGDLAVQLELEGEFRRLLQGRLLRVYHATRLLDHELSMIQTLGLRPLSLQLIKDRIQAAHAHSWITVEQRSQLEPAHVYADGHAEHRDGQVCLFLGTHTLHTVTGVASLLCTWGRRRYLHVVRW
jgi:hypothetical protein